MPYIFLIAAALPPLFLWAGDAIYTARPVDTWRQTASPCFAAGSAKYTSGKAVSVTAGSGQAAAACAAPDILFATSSVPASGVSASVTREAAVFSTPPPPTSPFPRMENAVFAPEPGVLPCVSPRETAEKPTAKAPNATSGTGFQYTAILAGKADRGGEALSPRIEWYEIFPVKYGSKIWWIIHQAKDRIKRRKPIKDLEEAFNEELIKYFGPAPVYSEED